VEKPAAAAKVQEVQKRRTGEEGREKARFFESVICLFKEEYYSVNEPSLFPP
jgi:hypothetical protein